MLKIPPPLKTTPYCLLAGIDPLFFSLSISWVVSSLCIPAPVFVPTTFQLTTPFILPLPPHMIFTDIPPCLRPSQSSFASLLFCCNFVSLWTWFLRTNQQLSWWLCVFVWLCHRDGCVCAPAISFLIISLFSPSPHLFVCGSQPFLVISIQWHSNTSSDEYPSLPIFSLCYCLATNLGHVLVFLPPWPA